MGRSVESGDVGTVGLPTVSCFDRSGSGEEEYWKVEARASRTSGTMGHTLYKEKE